MNKISLSESFTKIFGAKEEYEFFTPGRINLIGEHIDYNGGLVFPCAITYGTYALIRKREDNEIHFYSLNFPELGIINVDLSDLSFNESHNWVNYPKGVMDILQEHGYPIPIGLDILYYGNIPNGAGLSSSASIEVLTAWALNTIFDYDLSRLECIKISQQAENEYMGVNSGIMDQFAVGMGKENHGILLNTDTLKFQYVPIDLQDNVILICNTNKIRGLTDSAYNQRRAECEEALSLLQSVYNIDNLCDLSVLQLEEQKDLFKDTIIYNRAFHAISENERTKNAALLLEAKDLVGFGQLMNESHISLRDFYEVTGNELDTLVESLWNLPSTLGARVTGAGFGGCAIALVNKKDVDKTIESVSKEYKDKIGYDASFYVASIGEGAHQL